ncbi:hypothetical protein [Streptomyces sp. LN549]|uniref:hypothetical protein n=1 Tax=Streptomyces sp. LN549 TaxID=3112979 RepID=UPI00371879F9
MTSRRFAASDAQAARRRADPKARETGPDAAAPDTATTKDTDHARHRTAPADPGDITRCLDH